MCWETKKKRMSTMRLENLPHNSKPFLLRILFQGIMILINKVVQVINTMEIEEINNNKIVIFIITGSKKIQGLANIILIDKLDGVMQKNTGKRSGIF